MKIKIKYLIIGILAGLIIANLCAVAKCERLTAVHYDEFKDAYKRNTMLGEMEFFKVLEYDDHCYARVYYVGKGKRIGNVLTFDYEDGEWKEVSWNTLWSKTGNADKTIYPYWWHWVYFSFGA